MTRKFVAEVKESGDGQPYIVVEPNEENGLPDNKRITIGFPKDTPIEIAQDVAGTLNETVLKIDVRDW